MYDCKGQKAASKVWLCSRYGGGVKQKGETTAEFEHDAAEKGNTRGKIRGRRRHSIQPMVAEITAIGVGLGSPSPLSHPFSANLLDLRTLQSQLVQHIAGYRLIQISPVMS